MNSKRNAVIEPKSSATTMAELLASAKNKIHGFSQREKIKGKVNKKTSNSLILDIGGKSEGLVKESAFAEARDFIKSLKVGDEVWANVLVPETPDGFTLLSLRQTVQEASWQKLEKAKEKGEAVVVLGKAANPSGITVEVEGLSAFIPGSQLGQEAAKVPQNLVGKYFKAVPVEINRSLNKVVLSEKEFSEAVNIAFVKEALARIKPGDIYGGEVTTVASFGCFVRINLGADKKPVETEGLVYISELSWAKLESPSEVVSEGDKVKVKVLGMKDGKLSLSLKQAQKDPWEGTEAKYKKDSKTKGKVVRISDFGAFVELEPGVEGLVHLTKIPPGTKLEEGKEVDVYIEEIDSKSKRMSLGLVLTSKPVGYK